MTIHELEPNIKLGPFKLGKRLGRVVQSGEVIDLGGSRFSFPDGDGINSFSAHIVEENVVVVISSHDDDNYGYVQAELASLNGSNINSYPRVARKLRYIP